MTNKELIIQLKAFDKLPVFFADIEGNIDTEGIVAEEDITIYPVEKVTLMEHCIVLSEGK